MNKKRIRWTIVEIFMVTFISIHFLVLIFGMKKISMASKVIDCMLIFSIILLVLKKYIEIEALKVKNKDLKNEAYTDTHTGLPNRNSCEMLLRKYKRLDKNNNYGAIMFDLNNLKVINDAYGHKLGDMLLQNFAVILKNNASDNVFVGRYGGDEFIAFFLNEDIEGIEKFVKGVHKDVNMFNNVNREYNISYAFGYDLCSGDKKLTLKDILDAADKNMYENKAFMKTRGIKMASSL